MSEMDFENRLHSIAMKMEYPRTPEIAGFVTARLQPVTKSRVVSKGWAWSLTILFVLFLSLSLIPPARAAILEFIQIGIVRIFPRPIGAPVEIPRTATPESINPATATPRSDAYDLLLDLNRLAGETTLANAREKVPYEILLPTGFEEPDYAFLQEADGFMTILVWLDPNDPEKILMSLHFIPEGSWLIRKLQPNVIKETQVKGQRAFWTVGSYFLILTNGNTEFTRLMDGNVLIWEGDRVTYRLESNLSIQEAIKIAESLKPIP